MSGRPTTNQLEIIGERGTITVDLFHGFAVTFGGTVSRRTKVTRPFTVAASTAAAAAANLAGRAWRREPAYPGLRELLSRFYAAVRGQGPNPISPAETIAIARACERLEGDGSVFHRFGRIGDRSRLI